MGLSPNSKKSFPFYTYSIIFNSVYGVTYFILGWILNIFSNSEKNFLEYIYPYVNSKYIW